MKKVRPDASQISSLQPPHIDDDDNVVEVHPQPPSQIQHQSQDIGRGHPVRIPDNDEHQPRFEEIPATDLTPFGGETHTCSDDSASPSGPLSIESTKCLIVPKAVFWL